MSCESDCDIPIEPDEFLPPTGRLLPRLDVPRILARTIPWLEVPLSHLLLLTLFSVVPWLPAVSGDFVWLDHTEIVEGGYRIVDRADAERIWTQPLDQYIERQQGVFSVSGGYWRPLYAISLSLDWMIWRDRATLFHLENIVWHLFSVMAIYLFARRIMRFRSDVPDQWNSAVVLWSTCLFAVLPINVQSVIWISGRKDTLCTAFGVLAILLLWQPRSVQADIIDTRTADAADEHKRRLSGIQMPLLRTVSGLLCFLIAVGCKELGLAIPLVLAPLVLSEDAAVRRNGAGAKRLGFVLTLAAGVVLYRANVLGGIGLNAEYPTAGLWTNVGTFARVWWYHVLRVLWPFAPSISDSWSPSTGFGFLELVSLVGILVMIWVTARGLLGRKFWSYPVAWFVCWMLPVSGVLPLRHVSAERYLYPASWGIIFVCLVVWTAIMRRLRIPLLQAWVPVVVCCVVLAGHTVTQATYWDNDQALFDHSVSQDDHYAEGHLALSSLALDRGDYRTALAEVDTAIRVGLDSQHVAYTSPFLEQTYRGLSLYHLGEFESSRDAFSRALTIRPNNSTAYYHMGLVSIALSELPMADQYLTKSLQLNPDDALCRGNLAHVQLLRNEPAKCIRLLEPLVETESPTEVDLSNYGTAQLLGKDFAGAKTTFARLNDNKQIPPAPATLAKLAWAEIQLGETASARTHLRAAQRLDRNHATVVYVAALLKAAER